MLFFLGNIIWIRSHQVKQNSNNQPASAATVVLLTGKIATLASKQFVASTALF